jgi:hypothetical protein
MFKVTLVVCDKPKSSPDYSMPFTVPSVPREGDYVTVKRIDPKTGEPLTAPSREDKNDPNAPKHWEVETFVVKRVRWSFKFPSSGTGYGDETPGTIEDILVEVVPADSYWAHPNFKRGLPPNAPEFEWG